MSVDTRITTINADTRDVIVSVQDWNNVGAKIFRVFRNDTEVENFILSPGEINAVIRMLKE